MTITKSEQTTRTLRLNWDPPDVVSCDLADDAPLVVILSEVGVGGAHADVVIFGLLDQRLIEPVV